METVPALESLILCAYLLTPLQVSISVVLLECRGMNALAALENMLEADVYRAVVDKILVRLVKG